MIIENPLSKVVEGTFDIFKDWIKRKFPDPAEQKKAEQEFEKYISDERQADIEAFNKFVIDYEGSGKDVTPWLQNYRGSVRPTITYALIVAFVVGIFDNWPEEYIDLIYKLNLISMSFWYGERALKNLGLSVGTIFKKK